MFFHSKPETQLHMPRGHFRILLAILFHAVWAYKLVKTNLSQVLLVSLIFCGKHLQIF